VCAKEKGEEIRTDELTNGDLLGEMALRARFILPAVVYALTCPEELGEEEAESSNKCSS